MSVNYSDIITNQENICVVEPDIQGAFYDFIEKFGSIPKEAILQAYQRECPHKMREFDEETSVNLSSYALLSIDSIEARGSQIAESEEAENGQDYSITTSMQKASVEIEIFSLLQFEVQRSIQLLSSMFTHPRGIDFFNALHIAPLYAEKVTPSTKLEKESHYYSAKILFHFSYYSQIKEKVDTFSTINLSLQNTDTNYL